MTDIDTAYAVLRVARVKRRDLQSMGHHHARTNQETDVHIDPTRTHLNRVVIGSGDAAADIQKIASQYRMAKAAKDPLDDTVATEMILTAAASYFERDFKGWQTDPEVLQPWIDIQTEFLRTHESKMGIAASAVLHLDELAPHLHVALVPVADVRIKNRHSDRIERRISHGHHFSDDRATITKAHQYGTTATDTKLGRLQTTYATYIKDHGLDIERGTPKSHRKHVTPRQWRDTIAQDTPTPTPPVVKKPKTVEPIRDAIDIMTHGKEATILTQYAGAVGAFLRATADGLAAIQAKDTQIAALQTETKELKKETEMLKKELRTLTDKQQELAKELAKDKELLKSYREITQYELIQKKVATWPEIDAFTAQSGRAKFNALDFIKWREGADFQASVLILAETFSSERIAAQIAGDTAREIVPEAFKKADTDGAQAKKAIDALDADPLKKIARKTLTKSEMVKEQTIRRQTEVLGADTLYRITLMSSTGDKKTINLGKGRTDTDPERFYTAQDIVDLIPTLSYRNAHGYNILITPIPDEQTRFILLDDIRDLEKAKEYSPALILTTSPASRQALYKVAGDTPEPAARAFFTALNRELGDEHITGLIHPMRLAGFTNRKPKYERSGQYPFITIDHAVDIRSDKAERRIRAYHEEMLKYADTPAIHKKTAQADIKNAARWYQDQIDYWGDKTDYSKIDRRLAEVMATAGFTEQETKRALIQTSPNIEQRHPDLQAYITGKTNGLDFTEENATHRTRGRMKP